MPGSWSINSNFTTPIRFDDIACASSSVCVAVGLQSIVTTEDGGDSWSQPSTVQGSVLDGVACASVSTCIAVGNVFSSPSPALIVQTTDGGATWNPVTNPSPQGSTLTSVACPSATSCTAVGYSGTGADVSPVVMGTSDGGATWTVEPQPETVTDLIGVACPSVSVCYAVGGSGLETTTDGGSSWSELSAPGLGDWSGIACPSVSTCYAEGADSETQDVDVAVTNG